MSDRPLQAVLIKTRSPRRCPTLFALHLVLLGHLTRAKPNSSVGSVAKLRTGGR